MLRLWILNSTFAISEKLYFFGDLLENYELQNRWWGLRFFFIIWWIRGSGSAKKVL